MGGWVGGWVGLTFHGEEGGFALGAHADAREVGETELFGEGLLEVGRHGLVGADLEEVVGWVGGWVGWVEGNEAVKMSCCRLGVGGWVGWVEKNEAVQMSCWELWVGGWVG